MAATADPGRSVVPAAGALPTADQPLRLDCCGFFAFVRLVSEASVMLDVGTPQEHREIRTALAARAEARTP